jgi:hypothetical protein
LISGIYEAAQGAYVTATVYFPSPVDRSLEVPFLVDSGAATTCLSITDFVRLGDATGLVPFRPSTRPMRGVGGSITPHRTAAGILFVHDEGYFSIYGLDLHLILDTSFIGMPSLLGRDILYGGHMGFDPVGGNVTLDLPRGTHAL